MKKIFFAIVFVLLAFAISPGKISAQGTYNCFWNRPASGKQPFDCLPRPNDGCRGGYEPGTSCGGIEERLCRSAGPFQCEKEEEVVNTSSSESEVLCDDGVSVDTAIGCIPINDTNKLVGFVLGWAIGIGGGVAFLLIVFAGFQITTSSGNPERLQAGRELLTSAIAGLILLIFSVFVLRIIGIDILGINLSGT